jgi:phospholipid/cholesterol/gamma-HCH transport system substrate-binding protein
MTQHRRNIAVGLTVGLALVLLATMLLRFSDAPFRLFAKEQMAVTLVAVTSEGLAEGTPLYYRGVNVGRVVSLERSPDQRNVLIRCLVDAQPPLPGNLEAKIRTTIFGGTSSVVLYLVGTPTTRPDGQIEPDPQGSLTVGQQIRTYFAGIELLPPEFTMLANDLAETSQEIRRFSAELRQAAVLDQIRSTLDSLRRTVDAAGRAFEAADTLLADKDMRADLAASLAGIRAASESAARTGKELEALTTTARGRLDQIADHGDQLLVTAQREIEGRSRQLGARIDQLAEVLTRAQEITRKIDEGQGTAGALLNNPALYESLLDASKELKLTIQDLRRLIDQWEQEGVSLKLK